jgi:hypothetical protein
VKFHNQWWLHGKERIMLVRCVPSLAAALPVFPARSLPATMTTLTKSVCNAMQRIAPLGLAGSWDNVRIGPNPLVIRVSIAGTSRSDFY